MRNNVLYHSNSWSCMQPSEKSFIWFYFMIHAETRSSAHWSVTSFAWFVVFIARQSAKYGSSTLSSTMHNIIPLNSSWTIHAYISSLKLLHQFGSRYNVEVYDETNHTPKSRIIPWMAKYPCTHISCFLEIMSITTHRQVCRSQWIHMKTAQLIIDTMNNVNRNQTWIGHIDLQTPTPNQLEV
jgi:hypothetical protein